MKKIFFLIFLAWLAFFIFIPPFQLPDEPGHYDNIFWVSRFAYPKQPMKKEKEVKLYGDELFKEFDIKPITIEKIINSPLRKKTGYSEEEIKKLSQINLQSYHPPFYYISGSFLFHLANFLKLDFITRFYLTRLTSGLFYLGIILIVYQILKLIFANKKIVVSLLLFFAFNPTVVKAGIGINPDIGIAFFSYLFLFLVLKWSKKILKIRQIILLSIVSAITTLSKFSGIFTALFFALFSFFRVLFFRLKTTRDFIKSLFVFYLLFLILISPWFYFNFIRYGTVFTNAFYIAESRPINPQSFFSAIFQAAFEFRHTIMHYAGFIGARNELYPPKIFFISYTIIITLLALFGLLKILKKRKLLLIDNSFFIILISYFLSHFFFLYFLSFYFKRSGFSWDIQGRYFLPGFLPLTIFVYFGLGKFYKLMPIFAILHYLYILLFILIPTYWSF